MAVKTFTTGEVLTAADTNTYLNNGGLVYLKTVTVGSAVATVDVTSCFNSTYSQYRIVVDQIASLTSGCNVFARMLVGTTPNANGIYGILMYASVASSTAYVGASDVNSPYFSYLTGCGYGNAASCIFDVTNPFETRETRVGPSGFVKTVGGTDMGYYMGGLYNNTSYDGIRIGVSTGTMTGGTITVYGYRKA